MGYRDPEFLREHIGRIIRFYHPTCMDAEFGGYINQLRDDGSVFDRKTKHLVGTCRFIYCFSLASMVHGSEVYRKAAEHGLDFLQECHRRSDGGYAWVLSGRSVSDGTYHCYGHAFVLLAASGARKARVEGADEVLENTWALLEQRFWEQEAQLYVDEIRAGDWSAIDPYRGQNANMHMCEAMLAAYEATGELCYLDRAELLAKRICVDLAEPADGLIWEHYHADWTHDWNYNLDDPRNLFRPYGYLPGHFTEWSKLLLILNRHRPLDWLPEKAAFLFRKAMDASWVPSTGAINYAFAPDGKILDTDQYYWVFSETFAAAALLALETSDEEYWRWYDRVWTYSDKHFVDHRYGGWFRILDSAGSRYSDEKSPAAKTDYHPLAACYEVLEALRLA
ncbi:MAG: AGE family epimerase/isomerase [Boseongicola sp.]|nr:AGE family epimerase/isomerase [Boseongicola sp.]MDE0345633.1 AGE family epimerase/isomerase [Boseongicola sp.]